MSREDDGSALRAVEEQVAYVWTLRSEARVGGLSHETSSGPWLVLLSEERHLKKLLSEG